MDLSFLKLPVVDEEFETDAINKHFDIETTFDDSILNATLIGADEKAEEFAKFMQFFDAPKRDETSDEFVLSKRKCLESQGVFVWLQTIWPDVFEESFSEDHKKFWLLYWSVLLRLREQKKYLKLKIPCPEKFFISKRERVNLLVWGRGLGKSAALEGSSAMRGAILNEGYCLYVCESQDQAEEHLSNIKLLIENPDSRLVEFYPDMEIAENATLGKLRAKDRSDLFITQNGWICRAKGLNSKLRGIRLGKFRPDDIVIDDIDGVNDSIAVSLKKLKQLTSSVIGTQARRFVTIKLGQNLIGETSVVNLVHTGKADAFAERITIGVSNTFSKLEYESAFDEEDGRIKHTILPTSITTWSGVDLEAAQNYLHDVGIDVFLAEYQNEFEHLKQERVFHEYDEARHLITWEQFKKVFGVGYIPPHWNAKATADFGYSKESLSVWIFSAAAAKNSPLPSHYFGYRSLSFCQDSIDDQAVKVWEEMFPDIFSGKQHLEATQDFTKYPDLLRLLQTIPRCQPFLTRYLRDVNHSEIKKAPQTFASEATEEDKATFYLKEAQKTYKSQIGMWRISHEKTGEQKTLAQKYGIPAQKTDQFGADAGVTEANHLLKGTYTKPHPFHEDEEIIDEETQQPTGVWKLGCPYYFFIVDADQIKAPRDDRGMKVLREHIGSQRWTEEKLGELGLSKRVPLKYQSDACLVAGTMIHTINGQVPIEDIKEGDLILTRKGFRRCVGAKQTNPSAEIWTLTTADGKTLSGTANHPVWVEGKGFSELCLVRDADRILVCENEPNTNAKQSFLTTLPSTDTLHRLIGICGSIIGGIKINADYRSMSRYGNLSMVQSPPVITSTIKTTRLFSTIFQTLSVWTKNLTREFTEVSSRRKDENNPFRRWQKAGKLQRFGIEAKTDASGIVNTLKTSLLKFDLLNVSANTAVKHSYRKRLTGLSIVLPDANSENITTLSILKDRALTAAYRFCVQRKALNGIVRQNVANVSPTNKRKPVYNLTVEDVPEYFANGILTHNCDAFRMFAVDYVMPKSAPLTAREKVIDAMPQESKELADKPNKTMGEQLAFQDEFQETKEKVKRTIYKKANVPEELQHDMEFEEFDSIMNGQDWEDIY